MTVVHIVNDSRYADVLVDGRAQPTPLRVMTYDDRTAALFNHYTTTAVRRLVDVEVGPVQWQGERQAIVSGVNPDTGQEETWEITMSTAKRQPCNCGKR